MYIIIARF